MHKAHKLIRYHPTASGHLLFFGVPSQLVEWAHVDANSILEASHGACDSMVAATGREWNAPFARILDDLDYVLLAGWVDDSKVRWSLILCEAQIGIIKVCSVWIEWQVDSRLARQLLLKLDTNALGQ